MRAGLAALHYGNMVTGDAVDRFWLEGPLAISAVEQARFLADLARMRLAAPHDAQAAVREILFTREGQGWKLFAKTGAAMPQKPGLGWWVGWVEKDAGIYAFALNIDLEIFDRDLSKRVEIGTQALQALGIIP